MAVHTKTEMLLCLTVSYPSAVEYNVKITQTFLQNGHTQMNVDAFHAMNKNKISNKTTFLQSDYLRLSENERKKKPLEQKEVTYNFVQDISKPDLLIYSSIRPGKKPGDPCIIDLKKK